MDFAEFLCNGQNNHQSEQITPRDRQAVLIDSSLNIQFPAVVSRTLLSNFLQTVHRFHLKLRRRLHVLNSLPVPVKEPSPNAV